MTYEIPVIRTQSPKPRPADESKLGFAKYFTDHMFVMEYDEGRGWHSWRVEPHAPFLGEPVGVCEMCGHQIIRYVHHMVHPNFRSLGVGCICTGKMEGNIEQAKKREQDFKSKETRRENFKNRHWKTSKNSNSYLKIKDHLVVLYYNKNYNNWKYSLDNQFCPEIYSTREEAIDAAFEALEKLR